MRRKRRYNQQPKTLYSRVTVVVFNAAGEVLLVKHNRQNEWALPGGRPYAGEELERRATIEVAEETGLHIEDVRYAGRYAGTVASHSIYVALAAGDPRPNPRELQDAVWWDRIRPLARQQHVDSILALVGKPDN